MNNFFANLYEDYLLFDPKFSDLVFDANDYQFLGLGLILIPLVVFLIFYKIIDPQPVKVWKWLLTFLVSLCLVLGFSYYWVSTNGMYVPIQNDEISEMTATSFTLQLAFWSAVFSIVPALIFSLVWSRILSINNARNPF